MFKQYMQAKATDYVQVDACRLGGLSEVLAVLLLAAKFEIPIHPVYSPEFLSHCYLSINNRDDSILVASACPNTASMSSLLTI